MSNLFNNKICLKSPAKINLHLEIIGKRKDGFHELAMIMQNIDLADYLELENNSKSALFVTNFNLDFKSDLFTSLLGS